MPETSKNYNQESVKDCKKWNVNKRLSTTYSEVEEQPFITIMIPRSFACVCSEWEKTLEDYICTVEKHYN